MAPIPSWLLWPLRKAATIPVLGISFAMLGAAYGSYDITRRFITIPLPSSKRPPPNPTASLLSVSGSGIITVFIVTARERYFAPTVPKPPNLPLEGVPIETRIKNASTIALHTVINYPYQFRFTSAFVAGTSAGILYSFLNYVQNRSSGSVTTKNRDTALSTGNDSGNISMITTVPSNTPASRSSSSSSSSSVKYDDDDGDDDEPNSLEMHHEESDNPAHQSSVSSSVSRSSSSSTPSVSRSSSSSLSPRWVMVYDEDETNNTYYIPYTNTRSSSSSSRSFPAETYDHHHHPVSTESDIITSYKDNYSHTGKDPYEQRYFHHDSSNHDQYPEQRDDIQYVENEQT